MTWTLRAKVFFSLSALLLVFCLWVHISQPDALASVTVWPVWIWAFPGLLLTWFAFSTKFPKPSLLIGIAWLVYVIIIAEEPLSVVRSLLPAPASKGHKITVVSINCSGGLIAAALESVCFHPDIVLLQESPGRKQVQRIARKMFGDSGDYMYGFDCSIVSRRKLEKVDWGWSVGMAAQPAKTRIGGREVFIVSAHLAPVPFREDIWTSENRRLYEGRRQMHRMQIESITTHLRKLPAETPIIIGGDFNAPAGDGIFRLWDDFLTDSFKTAGRGWGNTFLNEAPAIRIDQIWASRQIQPLGVTVWRTLNSDHRLVVAELDLAR